MLILLSLLSLGALVAAVDFSSSDNDSHHDGDTIEGSSEDDVLNGTRGGDILIGHEGDDTISGGAGNDAAVGGEGDDEIHMGRGNDVYADAFSDAESDTLTARLDTMRDLASDFLPGRLDEFGDAAESLFTEDFPSESTGNDLINMGGGHDIALSGYGEDTLLGGAGNDTLSDFGDSSTIDGGDGNDMIAGYDDFPSAENGDLLMGGKGNDRILGDAGDRMWGGQGADTFAIDQEDSHNDNEDILRIKDFTLGTDRLEIAAYTGTENVITASAASNPAHSLLQLNGETIAILENTDTAAITAALTRNPSGVFSLTED